MKDSINEREMSLERQKERIFSKYNHSIISFQRNKGDREKLVERIMHIHHRDRLREEGHSSLMAMYFVLEGDFELAWITHMYLNIMWSSPNADYILRCKKELQEPTDWTARPAFGEPFFRLGDDQHNQAVFDKYTSKDTPPLDLSPAGRHLSDDYHLKYPGIRTVALVLEIAMHQERHVEAAECLWRMKFAVSHEDPEYFEMFDDFPNARIWMPCVNMYQCWLDARLTQDETRRKDLARQALCWALELGFRVIGKINCEMFDFRTCCEIIGEFALMEERQDEFLRHLKRQAAFASMSTLKKMLDHPVEMIPFAERDMPGYLACMNKYRAMFPK